MKYWIGLAVALLFLRDGGTMVNGSPNVAGSYSVIGALFSGGSSESGSEAVYYLDNSATGVNNGTEGNDAWQSWASASAGLNALPDKGGGCILIVKEGTGESYGSITRFHVTSQPRSNWLTIRAAPGERPLFDHITVRSQTTADIRDVRLRLDGLRFHGQVDTSGSLVFLWTRYVELLNLEVSTPGIIVPGGKYNPQYETGAGFAVRHGLIKGCTFFNGRRLLTIQDYGGWYPENVRVEDCEFYGNSDDALNLNGSYLYIHNNYFHDPNRFHCWLDLRGTIQDGPFLAGEIVRQDVTGAEGYYKGPMSLGISVYPYNSVQFVDAYTCRGVSSGACIPSADVDYCHQDCIALDTGSPTHHLDFRNNILNQKNVGEDTWSQGFKLNAKTPGSHIVDVNVVNNVIYGRGGHSFLLMGVHGLRMWNNLIANEIWFETRTGATTVIDEMFNNIFLSPQSGGLSNVWQQDQMVKDSLGYIRCLHHGNNYWSGPPVPAGGPSHPYVLDATERAGVDFSEGYFVDYAGKNYELACGSPLIGAGRAQDAPTTDVLGRPRDASPDIGPFGYIEPPAPAP